MINFRTAYKLKAAFAILILILITLVFILADINKVSDTYLVTVVFPIEVALSTVLTLVGLDISKNYYNFLYFKDYNKGCELKDKYKIKILDGIKEYILNTNSLIGICHTYMYILAKVGKHHINVASHTAIPELNRDIAINKFGADIDTAYWWNLENRGIRIQFLEYIINSIKNKSSK